jgi:hypothetical protein
MPQDAKELSPGHTNHLLAQLDQELQAVAATAVVHVVDGTSTARH